MGQPETPAPPRVQNSLYIQLALYACGNALAIVIGLILYNLWAVLRWVGAAQGGGYEACMGPAEEALGPRMGA